MRRTDREIVDINEIFGMLDRCTSACIGFKTDDYPYMIPMTFGAAIEDGKITVYFHCAGEGRKLELLAKDDRICVEAHTYERTEMTQDGGITAKYESVIGFGKAVRISETADKVAAMKIMLDHYDSSGFPVTSCKGLSKCEVYKVVLEEVTGKRNI